MFFTFETERFLPRSLFDAECSVSRCGLLPRSVGERLYLDRRVSNRRCQSITAYQFSAQRCQAVLFDNVSLGGNLLRGPLITVKLLKLLVIFFFILGLRKKFAIHLNITLDQLTPMQKRQKTTVRANSAQGSVIVFGMTGDAGNL